MRVEPDPLRSPSSSAPVEDVATGLRASRTERFEVALQTAVDSGAEGDRLLAELDGLKGWRQVLVVAALGDVRGPAGGTVLLRAISTEGSGASDVRCAAALALAKRNEPGATQALAGLVDDRDHAVRLYALFGLAAIGDGSAYALVLARVRAMLARRRTLEAADFSPLTLGVTYLLRHVHQDVERTPELTTLLRRGWQRMTPAEQGWFTEHWPDLHTGDNSARPERPDARVLQRQLLAHPLYASPAVQ